MTPKIHRTLVLLTLVAGLALATAPAMAEPHTSSDLLLPYFEVDVEGFSLTTLFAVGNASDEEVEVLATVHTNWGIAILEVPLTLAPNEVKTVNLRDWLAGNLPGRLMNAQDRGHMEAALRGQPSPVTDLYYGTEVAPGKAVGYITLRTQGRPRPDVLFGDYFIADPANDFAQGESLVVIDRVNTCIGACLRHAVRFLEGGGFDGGTELIVWTGKQGQPSATAYHPDAMSVATDFDAFEEPGRYLAHRGEALLPVQTLKVSDLALGEPFGWLEVTTEVESFIAVRYSAGGRYSVALSTFCLPDPPADQPRIRIEKATNGHDADAAPGPQLLPGSQVEWEYTVTNTGDVALSDVTVTDDREGAVTCPKAALEPGESMSCSAHGLAQACQYENLGRVTGRAPDGQIVNATDPSHYYGSGTGSVHLEKATNGHDADTAPGPQIAAGAAVTWTYTVTNTGEVELTGVAVSDDQEGTISCPKTRLAPGETMTCTAHGTAIAGEYSNLGTVTAHTACGDTVRDEDPSHYYNHLTPDLRIEKATNGHDADVAPGPQIAVGSPVIWTYGVTNTGQVRLTGVTVTDSDSSLTVSCPKTTLEPGESMTCTAHGIARPCQYENLGTALGTGPDGLHYQDTDPSHYYGLAHPDVKIEKATNGVDADTAPGPEIQVGATVTWTYAVTNTGDVPLTQVSVVDDQEGAVSCPRTVLSPGESMTCTAVGTAVAGQYENVGTVTAYAPCGERVEDDDVSQYHGETAGGEGCTPGYWKNHTDSWPPTGYSPSQSVSSVFSTSATYPALASASLLEALRFQGGSDNEGAAEILLRAAVAGLLDSSHPGVAYPRTPAQVIAEVNAALASGDRATMLTLATAIDQDNNLGCPLS